MQYQEVIGVTRDRHHQANASDTSFIDPALTKAARYRLLRRIAASLTLVAAVAHAVAMLNGLQATRDTLTHAMAEDRLGGDLIVLLGLVLATVSLLRPQAHHQVFARIVLLGALLPFTTLLLGGGHLWALEHLIRFAATGLAFAAIASHEIFTSRFRSRVLRLAMLTATILTGAGAFYSLLHAVLVIKAPAEYSVKMAVSAGALMLTAWGLYHLRVWAVLLHLCITAELFFRISILFVHAQMADRVLFLAILATVQLLAIAPAALIVVQAIGREFFRRL